MEVKTRIIFLVMLISTAFVSCAPGYKHYEVYEDLIIQGEMHKGVEQIKESQKEYGSKSRLLYLMDTGLALHYAGEYEKSINYFAQAEDLIDILYTKSLTTEAATLVTNENLKPYEGEDFEKVMVNVFQALNYTFLGKSEDALVEARKVNHKLSVLNDSYDKKNIYKKDAFANYLSGLLYDNFNELNDAMISYRDAYDEYYNNKKYYKTDIPELVKEDLLQTLAELHITDELEEYKKLFREPEWEPEKKDPGAGELVFISYEGLAPLKVDEFLDAPVKDGQGGVYILRIAFPRFEKRSDSINGCTVEVGEVKAECDFMEDIENIAIQNLKDKRERITAKTIARVASKYLLAKEIRERASKDEDNVASFVAKVATDLYSVITEESDKRSWRLLPAHIRMVKMKLPAGEHTVKIKYTNANGAVIKQKDVKVQIKEKEIKYLPFRIVK